MTYRLTDDAGGRFAINPTTGVVMANGALLNYETATSHTITVQASDGSLNSSDSFTINVGNVAPSTPADSNAAANSVVEGPPTAPRSGSPPPRPIRTGRR